MRRMAHGNKGQLVGMNPEIPLNFNKHSEWINDDH